MRGFKRAPLLNIRALLLEDRGRRSGEGCHDSVPVGWEAVCGGGGMSLLLKMLLNGNGRRTCLKFQPSQGQCVSKQEAQRVGGGIPGAAGGFCLGF